MIRCWSHNSEVNIPAAYRWMCRNGNVVALCIECCAAWRKLAVEDPDLAPARIETLRAASGPLPDP